MKVLATIFAILFLFAFTATVCFLFHIGGTESTSNLMYDRFAAVSFLEACAFFYIYLKLNNKISTK
jgi:hypothetical protein